MNLIRLIGIDPGSYDLGLALIEVDFSTLKIHSIKTYNINPVREVKYDITRLWSDTEDYETISFDNRINYIGNYLYYYFCSFKPDYITIESPFFDRNKPNAYGQLVILKTIIQRAIHRYNNDKIVLFYSPRTVKISLDVREIKGKEAVREGLLKNEELSFFLNKLEKTRKLTSHEIDAIGVAYTHILNLRN